MALSRRALLGGLAGLSACSAAPSDDCPGGFAGRPGCERSPIDPRGTRPWEGTGCPPEDALPSVVWNPDTPIPFSGGCEAADVDGEIFVLGTKYIFSLPPGATTWKAHPLPVWEAREHPASIWWRDAAGAPLLLRIGGAHYDPAQKSSVDLWNPNTATLEAMPPLPAPRVGASAFLHESRLFVAGGTEPSPSLIDRASTSVFSYDLTLGKGGSWKEESPMPEPRAFAGTVVLGDVAYLLGGATVLEREHFTLAYATLVMDLASGQWRSEPPPPAPRALARAVGVCDRILLVGGKGEGDVDLSSIDLYLPLERRWIAAPWLDLPFARSSAGVLFRDDRLLCLGGDAQRFVPGWLEGGLSWRLP